MDMILSFIGLSQFCPLWSNNCCAFIVSPSEGFIRIFLYLICSNMNIECPHVKCPNEKLQLLCPRGIVHNAGMKLLLIPTLNPSLHKHFCCSCRALLRTSFVDHLFTPSSKGLYLFVSLSEFTKIHIPIPFPGFTIVVRKCLTPNWVFLVSNVPTKYN